MGFANVKSLVESLESTGKYQITSFRKAFNQLTNNGSWSDSSFAPGSPQPNYYASTPLVAATLTGSTGLYHGENVSPDTKHLTNIEILTPGTTSAPLTLILCDYLLYYPFINMDQTASQSFTNSVTLPRYTDGVGVQMFLVASYPYIGGANVTITYTNSAGTAGRTTPTLQTNTGGNIATIVTGRAAVTGYGGCFLPLQAGDTGVRSVQSIIFDAPNGGTATLVLVKPLASLIIRENTAPVSRNYLTDVPNLARIYDGAYLNFVVSPVGSLNTQQVLGSATFAWGTS